MEGRPKEAAIRIPRVLDVVLALTATALNLWLMVWAYRRERHHNPGPPLVIGTALFLLVVYGAIAFAVL